MKDYASRQFLNADQSRAAFIVSYVTSADGSASVEAEITIADCSRIITLDFNTWGNDSASEHLDKLEVLQREIREFARRYKIVLRAKGFIK